MAVLSTLFSHKRRGRKVRGISILHMLRMAHNHLGNTPMNKRHPAITPGGSSSTTTGCKGVTGHPCPAFLSHEGFPPPGPLLSPWGRGKKVRGAFTLDTTRLALTCLSPSIAKVLHSRAHTRVRPYGSRQSRWLSGSRVPDYLIPDPRSLIPNP